MNSQGLWVKLFQARQADSGFRFMPIPPKGRASDL